MASKKGMEGQVSSGFWTPEQRAMMVELSNPAPANMDPRSDPVQSWKPRPPASTPRFGSRKRAS